MVERGWWLRESQLCLVLVDRLTGQTDCCVSCWGVGCWQADLLDCLISCWRVHWLIDWLIPRRLTYLATVICADEHIGRLIDWLLASWSTWLLDFTLKTEEHIGCLLDWLLANWPTWLLHFMLKSTLVDWLTGCWQADLPGCWISPWRKHRLFDWLVVGLLTYLTAWLHAEEYIGRFIDWLLGVGRLTNLAVGYCADEPYLAAGFSPVEYIGWFIDWFLAGWPTWLLVSVLRSTAASWRNCSTGASQRPTHTPPLSGQPLPVYVTFLETSMQIISCKALWHFNRLKVLKCEIFQRCDFYSIKPFWVVDLGAKI